MTEQEHEAALDFIGQSLARGDMTALASSVAESLVRLVAAQEKLVELAMIDLDGQVDAGVEGRAQELAGKIVEDNKKRGFIGQKK